MRFLWLSFALLVVDQATKLWIDSSFTLYERVPVIPGVNDDEENLRAMAHFLLGLERVPPVDILPYHRLGVDKYHRMGREYLLEDVDPPQAAMIGNAVRHLTDAGLDVTVRGEPYGND